MQAFLEFVLKNLVDHPGEVSVKRVEVANGRALYEIRVRPGDVGKVVGKQGQTISAIRGIMMAAASKFNERVEVEIVEESHGAGHQTVQVEELPPAQEPGETSEN